MVSVPTCIDAHQHFWRLGNPWTDWPTRDLVTIHRDFGPDELASHLSEAGVDATVLVQAAPDVAETNDMLRVAEETSFVAGVVGWVDFNTPNTACSDLDVLADNPAFRGVRPMLQAIEDEEWVLDGAFDPVFETLVRRDLVFDALAQPRHVRVIRKLALRHPELTIVLDHAAKPAIRDRVLEPWARDMRTLAADTGALCKLSGLVTEARADDGAEVLRPFVEVIFDAFGPDRVLWGSDWPVVNLAGGYARWAAITNELLAFLSDDDRAAVRGGNAVRAYQLRVGQEKSRGAT